MKVFILFLLTCGLIFWMEDTLPIHKYPVPSSQKVDGQFLQRSIAELLDNQCNACCHKLNPFRLLPLKKNIIMEPFIKSITLFTAIGLTGLSAGFFYSWSVSVIPGTRKITDAAYLETMQSVNRAILNPAFFLIFFGSLLLLAISTIQQYQTGVTFWLMLAATVIYLTGTFGVTALGNVPLNNKLDALHLKELALDQSAQFRHHYEARWNRLHLVRTVCAVLSFMLSLLASFTLA